MANHTLDNPIGIDKPIQDLQNTLYKKLNWYKTEMFGRVHKNEIDGGVVPQHFIKGEEYLKDVYIDDKNHAHVFFVCSDEHKKAKDGVRFTNEVKVVFMVNLRDLFPENKNRADSQVQDVAYRLIKRNRAFEITGIQTGLNNVLAGFNTRTLKKADLQPWHIFSISTSLTYHINSNC